MIWVTKLAKVIWETWVAGVTRVISVTKMTWLTG